MKPGIFPALLLSVFFFFCDGQEIQDLAKKPIPDLTGTVWEHRRLDIENGIDDRKGWYSYYDCEVWWPFKGTYVVNDDILYLREIGTVSEAPGSPSEIKAYSHLVLTDKGLKMFHNTVMDNLYSRTWARRYFWESGEGTHLTWIFVKREDNQIHNAE